VKTTLGFLTEEGRTRSKNAARRVSAYAALMFLIAGAGGYDVLWVDLEHSTIEVLSDYLAAGGTLIFNTAAPFDWFYYRLLRPLIIGLGPRVALPLWDRSSLNHGMLIGAWGRYSHSNSSLIGCPVALRSSPGVRPSH